jgi:hypothetical protein
VRGKDQQRLASLVGHTCTPHFWSHYNKYGTFNQMKWISTFFDSPTWKQAFPQIQLVQENDLGFANWSSELRLKAAVHGLLHVPDRDRGQLQRGGKHACWRPLRPQPDKVLPVV